VKIMVRWRLGICLVSVLSLGACGDDASSPTAPSPGGNSVTISIPSGAEFRTTDAFGTNPLNVPLGSTVVWTNNDTTSHDPTSDTGVFSLSPISPGRQGSVTLSNAGTVTYHCGIHPNMVGTIVVQ
jgi:plastocyanin